MNEISYSINGIRIIRQFKTADEMLAYSQCLKDIVQYSNGQVYLTPESQQAMEQAHDQVNAAADDRRNSCRIGTTDRTH